MTIIQDVLKKYSNKIDFLDLELIIAHELQKSREFVLAHPEYRIPKLKIQNLKFKISRRRRNEPLAYILGQKEFFGLDFAVNKHTLIPRPETELLVEKVLKLAPKNKNIIDVGTGSGNIIVSLAKNIKEKNNFYAIDISEKALAIARQNAKLHKVNKKIKFLKGNLLEPILKKNNLRNAIIIANLPYLSKEIYNVTAPAVKKYEPKSALYSPNEGLNHYEKLLKQIKEITKNYKLKTTNYLEISPEQKLKIEKLIKSYFPKAKVGFHKDLAGKWRVCRFEI